MGRKRHLELSVLSYTLSYFLFACYCQPKITDSGQFRWKGPRHVCTFFPSESSLQISALWLTRAGELSCSDPWTGPIWPELGRTYKCVPFKNWLVGPARLDKWNETFKLIFLNMLFCGATEWQLSKTRRAQERVTSVANDRSRSKTVWPGCCPLHRRWFLVQVQYFHDCQEFLSYHCCGCCFWVIIALVVKLQRLQNTAATHLLLELENPTVSCPFSSNSTDFFKLPLATYK